MTSAGGAPAVGNVLGFSLLLRHREAVVTLEERTLRQGVHLRRYEGLIPDVEFPIHGALTASRFRHHRCFVTSLELGVDLRVLDRWLEQRLVGTMLLDWRIRTASLEPCPEADEPPRIRLALEAVDGHGRCVGASIELALTVEGRFARAIPCRVWRFGAEIPEPEALLRALAEAIGIAIGDDGSAIVDVLGPSVHESWVRAGWKAPGLERVRDGQIRIDGRQAAIVLSDEAFAPAPNGRAIGFDPIAVALDDVRERIEAEDWNAALQGVAELDAALGTHGAARRIAAKWRVELARRTGDETALIAALDALGRIAPTDLDGRRWTASALGRLGRWPRVARLLVASARLERSTHASARAELALATVLHDKLHDPVAALAVLDPLVDRVRQDHELDGLFAPALVELACARARMGSASVVVSDRALREALSLLPRPTQRADACAKVATAHLESGRADLAHVLLGEAAALDPELDLVGLRIDAATRSGALDQARALLRARLDGAPDEAEALPWRRRLVGVLLADGSDRAAAEALGEVRRGLAAAPGDTELLELGARLERRTGSPTEAVGYLERLAETTADVEERSHFVTELAELLLELGRPEQAWAAVRPLLAADPIAPELVRVALLATPIDELAEVAGHARATTIADFAGRHLLQRAGEAATRETEKVLLVRATELLDDPRPAWLRLCTLAEGDPRPWVQLAELQRTAGDREGELESRRVAGLHWLHRGHAAEAIRELERAVALRPAVWASRAALAVALSEAGEPAGALAELEALLAVPADEVDEALRGGDSAKLPRSRAALTELAGQLAIQTGDLDEAADLLRRARDELPEGDPARIAAACKLAEILVRLERHDDAREAFSWLAGAHDGRSRAEWLWRAAGQARPEDAIPLLEQAVIAAPDDAGAWATLEHTLVAHGRWQGWVDALRRGLAGELPESLRPVLVRRMLDLVVAGHARLGDDELEAVLRESVAARPEDVEAQLLLGSLLSRAGRADEAEAWDERVLALLEQDDPRATASAERLARRALERGDAEWAARLARRVLHLNPTAHDALQLLWQSARRLGEPSLTLEAAEGLLASEDRPDRRVALALEAARACRSLDRSAAAFAHLRAASEALVPGPALLSWLELGLEAASDLRAAGSAREADTHEAWLRARLRHVTPDVAADEALAEVGVLRRLRRDHEALELAVATLLRHPTRLDTVAIVAELAGGLGHPETTTTALHEAIARCEPGAVRDALLGELARIHAAAGHHRAVLEALDGARTGPRLAPELLDLRLEAARQLGTLEPELRALWAALQQDAGDHGTLVGAALQWVREFAGEKGLGARERAELVRDLAASRPDVGGELMLQAATGLLDEPDALAVLQRALLDQRAIGAALELARREADHASEPDRRVAALRRVATLATETLDTHAATRALERARELAPSDSDVLLELIDRYLQDANVLRAVETTVEALATIPMGAAASFALAERAADAALARGDLDLCGRVLEAAVARLPDDPRIERRLRELEALVHDPDQRVRLLATIAERRSGPPRWEALEERARLLVDPLGRIEEAIEDLRALVDEAGERETNVDALADLLATSARWDELVALLEHTLPGLHGRGRVLRLERIAALSGERLGDWPRAEQALRLALEELGTGGEGELADRLHERLAACLGRQGRFSDLARHLERELGPDLAGAGPEDRPLRTELMIVLARTLRDELGEADGAAAVYETLERRGRLPDEGLATLVRVYRQQQRHEDLVRVLELRAARLEAAGDHERKAELDRRIAELLEGPLRRPHEAAHRYVEAFLADPDRNVAAGARARVLLSATDAPTSISKRLRARLETLAADRHHVLLTLLGDVLAPHDEAEAEAAYRRALDLIGDYGPALDGLGRLMLRRRRFDAAVEPLVAAARDQRLGRERTSETACLAARTLRTLGRLDEAETLLGEALVLGPSNHALLLELASLHQRRGRIDAEREVLERVAHLPLPARMRAEVEYRKALCPSGADAGEDNYMHLQAAVEADPGHAPARHALVDAARARGAWDVVCRMHELALKDLGPGSARARIHLELAELQLDRIGDVDAALRNLEDALALAADDVLVVNRAGELAVRLPDPATEAERLERLVQTHSDLDEGARARMSLLASTLHRRGGRLDRAEACLKAVLAMPTAPVDALFDAQRELEEIETPLDPERLPARRTELIHALEAERDPKRRLAISIRLRQVARQLGDGAALQATGRELLELAQTLAGGENDRERALVALRALADEPDPGGAGVLASYESVVEHAGDRADAAALLAEAARFAWQTLADPATATTMLRRALERAPDHPHALAVLDDMVLSSPDAVLEEVVLEGLRLIDPVARGPAFEVQMGELLFRCGRHEEALAGLGALLHADLPAELRHRALVQLDALLAQAGDADHRRRVLAALFQDVLERPGGRVAELALALADIELGLGLVDAAARTCESALVHTPRHRGLLEFYTRLVEREERWPMLGELLERAAELETDPGARANLLVRAATVDLEHGQGAAMLQIVRARLEQARRIDPGLARAAELLIPVLFTQGDLHAAVEIGTALAREAGPAAPEIAISALAAAVVSGDASLAQTIGPRHDAEVWRARIWPALRELAQRLAMHGPLPRLDALLQAVARLSGSGTKVLEGLRAWAAGQTLQGGLTLALARLHEAQGHADHARHLYQLAAFMMPGGPVAQIVDRLPAPVLPGDPYDDPRWAAVGYRGPLRTALVTLRDAFAGITAATDALDGPRTPAEEEFLAAATKVVAPWRRLLGLPLPIALTHWELTDPVQVRNLDPPTLVLAPAARTLDRPELVFRLAQGSAAIATGLALVHDPQGATLRDLLEAMSAVFDVGKAPSSASARALAHTLVARGLRPTTLGQGLRSAVATEISRSEDLERITRAKRRSNLLFAVRLSGRLDGALAAIARDHGLVGPDGPDVAATLRTQEAQWLLLAVELL